MIKSPNYITPAGLKKLTDELHQLLHVERPTIVKTVAWAASNGDRSENADYIYGKRRMAEIDRRIRFLQSRLDNIEAIDPSKVKSDRIGFGAFVTIEDEDGSKQTYQIVGVDESDVTSKKISYESPLAKALMGKKEGDAVIVKRPKGDVEVVVVDVRYGDVKREA